MAFNNLQEILFDETQSIRSVMATLDRSVVHTMGTGFGLVVAEDGRLTGVVTDGDIRRCLSGGACIDAPISVCMNRDFVAASADQSQHQILRLFEHRIRQIPVLDEMGRPVDLIQFSRFRASARMASRVIRSRAPVRVSFGGGGTDMSFYFNKYVGRVLSMTINKHCYSSISVRDDKKIRLVSSDYDLVEEADDLSSLTYGSPLDLIKACIRLMEPDFGFELETFSEIAPGTGLGGSSAMAASVLGALNHFTSDSYLDNYQLADLAYQAERIELGVAGGWQDQFACIFGGMNLIEFRKDDIMVVPLKTPMNVLLELHFNLLLFRFGESRQSGAIVADQYKTYRTRQEDLQAQYHNLAELALKMKWALLLGD
jgi:D-glycero-alpha-D-manno-heptose-7-phosphate kinase